MILSPSGEMVIDNGLISKGICHEWINVTLDVSTSLWRVIGWTHFGQWQWSLNQIPWLFNMNSHQAYKSWTWPFWNWTRNFDPIVLANGFNEGAILYMNLLDTKGDDKIGRKKDVKNRLDIFLFNQSKRVTMKLWDYCFLIFNRIQNSPSVRVIQSYTSRTWWMAMIDGKFYVMPF